MPRYERDWDRRLDYCFLHSKSSALDVRTSAELDPDGIPTVSWRCDHFVARLPTDFWPPRVAALAARPLAVHRRPFCDGPSAFAFVEHKYPATATIRLEAWTPRRRLSTRTSPARGGIKLSPADIMLQNRAHASANGRRLPVNSRACCAASRRSGSGCRRRRCRRISRPFFRASGYNRGKLDSRADSPHACRRRR
jgi:hypothetical protein